MAALEDAEDLHVDVEVVQAAIARGELPAWLVRDWPEFKHGLGKNLGRFMGRRFQFQMIDLDFQN